MTDDPSTDIVGYTDPEEVDKLVGAVAILEEYAKDLPTLAQFRQAAAALTSNLLMDSLSGKYPPPKNMKEAIQTANNVIDLVVKRDMAALGDELAKVDDPAERKALFDEFKQKAKEAQGKG